MRKFLLSLIAGIFAFCAYPAEIADYCGEFQCKYLDEFNLTKIIPVTIAPSATEGKIAITGLYAPAGSDPFTVDADIDLTAGTVTIPCVTLEDIQQGAVLYHGKYKDGRYTDYSLDPIVANLDNGNIVFKEDDVILFGMFDPDPEYCTAFTVLRKIKLSPKQESLEFVYNEDEWTRIGTAQCPDLCFAYRIFNTLEPIVTTVEVVQDKWNPNRIALLNPYDSSTWKNVNRDQESIGQIVIDMTDKDFVIFEPYVYSGFTYNLDGNNYGKCYVYNLEGYFTRINEMTKEEVYDRYVSSGMDPVFTSFADDRIHCALGSVIFATEAKPTSQYQMGPDREGDIVFDEEAAEVLSKLSGISLAEDAEDAPEAYYDLMGNKVSQPQHGAIYICRKGSTAKKVIF